MVSPKFVVTISLNVTATEEGQDVDVPVADEDVLVPVALLVETGVTPEVVVGQAVFVALLHGPVAELAEQLDGTLFADGSPQEAGTALLRRSIAVRNEA